MLFDASGLLVLVASSVGLVSVLMACLFCRKRTPKDDLLGLDGMVKITNPDENINHIQTGNANCHTTIVTSNYPDVVDSSKRSSGNNPHRSLPDIPITEGNARIGGNNTVLWECAEVNGDTSSELYATVDDKLLSESDGNRNKRHTLPNGLESRPHNSVGQNEDNFPPYSRLKENAYDKLKKTEHPYAKVQKGDGRDDCGISEVDSKPGPSHSVQEPVAPPRARRTSSQNSLILAASGVSLPGSVSDIPAATAVAGRVAASQDLPYMTPPITQPQHFSGDSQDSSKGYTSISVREPLANIIAQTRSSTGRRQEFVDPHYATVSEDDSDEMYAAIDEPNNQIYTSGSETYAQIQPVNAAPAASRLSNVQETCPQPPSVDSLKHVAHAHSRQASSSSCTSSVANLGSPKPEKRSANSPLPAPPGSTDDHEQSRPDSSARNLEDMYAKVQKVKKRHDEGDQHDNETKHIFDLRRSHVELYQHDHSESSGGRKMFHCYETLNKDRSGPESILSNDPGYEVLGRKAQSDSDPNYETLRSCTSPGSNKSTDFSKSSTEQDEALAHGYSVVNKRPQEISYEQLQSKFSSESSKDFSLSEPNYESMPSDYTDEHYTSVNKTAGSETDPNYESVKHLNPDYESVKYFDIAGNEPPYESFQEDSLPGYERIKDRSNEPDDGVGASQQRTEDDEMYFQV